MRPPEHPLALAILGVPALLFGGAVRLRNRYYDRNGVARRSDLPVISVGNLTAGGTGKTPIVAWLVHHLRDRGHTPAVVSRGYGGRAGAGPHVVSLGRGPLVGPDHCGDEPFLLARALERTVVIVGADRVAGARAAADAGCDVVVLDDGFQHRRLARDLDMVLLDASNPFGNYRLLPAGLLREPVSGLRRADLVMITRSQPGESFPVIERIVRHHNTRAPIVYAGHRPLGFFDAEGQPAPRPARAVAFCGIGNPARFRIDLERAGVDVVTFESWRDHHRFTTDDVRRLERLAARQQAVLVTTEKDLARMQGGDVRPRAGHTLLTLRIEAVVHDPPPALGAIDAVLESPAP
jgi:tetraacyldisaccharide 4'-kinase